MSEKHYYQPEIETMPEEQIRALQSEKLVKAVQHVYADVPYYRDLMDKAGVKPEDSAMAGDKKGRRTNCPPSR